MNVGDILRGGLAIGAAVFAWQVVSAALVPGTPWFVPVAFGLQVGVLIVLLSRRAARPWRERFALGAGASAIGAVIVFLGSLLCTQLLFPGLLDALGPNPPSAVAAAGGGFMGTLVSGAAFSAVFPLPRRR